MVVFFDDLQQNQKFKAELLSSLLTLHFCEPFGLSVMLRGTGHSVEEHQQKHQPVEISGLDGNTTILPHCVVQLTQLVTIEREKTDLMTAEVHLEEQIVNSLFI